MYFVYSMDHWNPELLCKGLTIGDNNDLTLIKKDNWRTVIICQGQKN